ncbi:phospholipase D-like domain-containing protein, partial [Bacteroidota bacterium]
TNPNYNNLVLDYNNMISIQDQSLAKAYLIEFNELWGSTGVDPDTVASRSGADKIDDTPHQFNVNGTYLELYFSPSDLTTAKIAGTLESATESIDFALMAFTENVLGDALVYAKNKNITVQGIIDYVEYTGSEFLYLSQSGMNVVDFKNPDGSSWPDGPTLHHKFAVIDEATAHAKVITGSHNWTASAESRNDENTLIIHNPEIAHLFKMEFDRVMKWLQHPPVKPITNDDEFEIHHKNPVELNVLENDAIAEGMKIEIVENPEYGTCSLLGNNQIVYESQEGRDDLFTYRLFVPSYPQFADTATVALHIITGTGNPGKPDEIVRIFPNPSGVDLLTIDLHTEHDFVRILLMDISGRILREVNTTGREVVMDVNEISSGTYIIGVHIAGGQCISRKWMKL